MRRGEGIRLALGRLKEMEYQKKKGENYQGQGATLMKTTLLSEVFEEGA